MPWTRAIPSLLSAPVSIQSCLLRPEPSSFVTRGGPFVVINAPDGENTSSLGEAGFLLNASDSLFEDGGDFGGGGLRISSVAPNLL